MIPITPILASGALKFAFEKATTEGKITIVALLIVSMFSWTVIITKIRQLYRAAKSGKKFFKAYRETRDPLDLARQQQQFDGAPAFEVYDAATAELDYHLKNNPITVKGQKRISHPSFDSVKIAIERTASAQAMALEKGMIVLSTAVAGGPFIGLLGTVWGVMETFSGVAKAASASLTAMAPGVAGALIATVVGLMVAIPAMFAYNFMVTSIRHTTQELDDFSTELVTAMEHRYVDNRALADEISDSLRGMKKEQDELDETEPAIALV